jgi:hypothetical protein
MAKFLCNFRRIITGSDIHFMLNLSGIREENMDLFEVMQGTSTCFQDTELAGIEIAIDDIPLRVRSPSGKNLSSAYFISLDLSQSWSSPGSIKALPLFETIEDVTLHFPSMKEDDLGAFVTDMVLGEGFGRSLANGAMS